MSVGRWIGVLLLAGTAILYFHSKSLNDPAQWSAVESPLTLGGMDRQTEVPEFKATASGKYLIEIEFPAASVPGSPFLIGCMAGVLKGPVNCKDQPDLLDVTWSVASDGQTVAVGAASDFAGEGSIDAPNNKMTRLVGRFPANKGDAYLLKLNLHAAPKVLASGATKLKVRPDVVVTGAVASGYESILMLMMGGGGLVLLVVRRAQKPV